MTRDRVLNWIGFGLVAVCFIASLYRIFLSEGAVLERSDRVTIRFAHWQLESGIREAFDEVSREYMKLHPGIAVEQITIPEKIYPNWFITQLVGGTAPDLMEMGAITVDRLGRYFEPVTRWADEPNPYNSGTPLEGIPWRDTFLDGLSSPGCYNQALSDYYGIGLNVHTQRLYYNKALYAEIFGGDAKPPESFEEFMEVCRRADEYGKRRGAPLIPIAGSSYNGPRMIEYLFRSETQRELLKWDSRRVMAVSPERLLLRYLEGRWSLETPAVAAAIGLTRELGERMTPGFMQLKREDATFYFLQQRALMIMSGSWDVKSIQTLATFPVEICRFLPPSREAARYGEHVLGPISEVNAGTATTFGLSKGSRHREEAIDFLRFLTSYRGNGRFAELSQWLPAIVKVPVPKAITAFKPLEEGYIAGFSVPHLGADMARAYNIHINQLFRGPDSVRIFNERLASEMRGAAISDLRRLQKGRQREISRSDTTVAALWVLQNKEAGETAAQRKFGEVMFRQNTAEMDDALSYAAKKRLNLPGMP